MTRKALGRGLEALIPRSIGESQDVGVRRHVSRETVPLESIRPNPWQPRRTVDPVKMDELVRSIEKRGVLEPLLVRPVSGMYELVAGERRLQAAQRAGMKEVPVIIIELDDKQSLEVALIENIQREDLNPVDEARAYQILIDTFERTHEEVASQVGKDRSTVSNLVRLLKLPDAVLEALSKGALTVGHARPLLSFTHPKEQERWARRIVDGGWSVREAERRIAARLQGRQGAPRASARPMRRDPHLQRVEEAVKRRVGTEVRLSVGRKGGGKLEFRFADQNDLERILELLEVRIH